MNPKRHKWSKRTRRQCNSLESNLDALLLHRICDVMLKAIKTGRPLVHLIKAWAIVGPHLIEVGFPDSIHIRPWIQFIESHEMAKKSQTFLCKI